MTARLVRVAAAVFGTALFAVPTHLRAQDERDKDRDRDGSRSLDIGVNGKGVSFGDSKEWTGLRFTIEIRGSSKPTASTSRSGTRTRTALAG